MGIRIIKYLTFIIIIALIVIGVILVQNALYKVRIENAYSNLKIGMTKEEVGSLFRRFKLIKNQTIAKYGLDLTEERMRYVLKEYKTYKELHPQDIFEKLPFDGNIKVFSYYIDKTLQWPYGWDINYIAIFYNQSDNKVVGWGVFYDSENIVKEWGEKF